MREYWFTRKGHCNLFGMRDLLLLGLGVTIASAALYAATANEQPLTTVPRVDLTRYLGRWYEIARYPNRFEKQCERDVTATYTLREDGRIGVLNACVKHDGSPNEGKGWAKIVDTSTNAKLKVTFFWPFFGDYWVLELGHNYEYAVVGEPSRKYLWILSRAPHMSDAQYSEVLGRLASKGYNPGKLIRVAQTAR
jgi:apolipoprotein D and lipocalin family protein